MKLHEANPQSAYAIHISVASKSSKSSVIALNLMFKMSSFSVNSALVLLEINEKNKNKSKFILVFRLSEAGQILKIEIFDLKIAKSLYC